MCYNFATFVLYLDVITLIYREDRLTSSETSLSAINIENQCFTKLTPDFTPENVKSGVFCLRLTIDIGAGGSLPKVVTHRLEVDTGSVDF